jgi:uncharacterized protein YkwD
VTLSKNGARLRLSSRISKNMARRLALVAATSLLLVLAASGTAAAGPYSYLLPPQNSDRCGGYAKQTNTLQSADSQEAIMHCLHNYARRKEGKAALTSASKLVTSSGKKAIDLRECSFSLRSSDPHQCGPGGVFYRIEEARYCYRSAGENVYWGWGTTDASTPSPRQAMDWWLNSTGHRNGLLNSNHTQAGFGLAKGKLTGYSEPYGRSWVAHFAKPCS